MKTLKRLAIIGSADFGQLAAYHAATDKHYRVVGFFDDYRTPGDLVNGKPILGKLEDVETKYQAGEFEELFLAVGYKYFKERKEIFEKYSIRIPFSTIIHSSTFVDPSCKIGQGAFILPGCVLDRNVVIGNNVLINTGSVIAHDSQVGDHSFLSPAVSVAGFVSIGCCCNIGINTTVIDNVRIADHVQTGGGTVVIKDLDQSGLYVGNPARFVR